MTVTVCPQCNSEEIRTIPFFNVDEDRWEWIKGCNTCVWEARDEDEEALHPEYYTRMDISPAKINKDNVVITFG